MSVTKNMKCFQSRFFIGALVGALMIFSTTSHALAEEPLELNLDILNECIHDHVVYVGEQDPDNHELNFYITNIGKLSQRCSMLVRRVMDTTQQHWSNKLVAEQLRIAAAKGRIPGLNWRGDVTMGQRNAIHAPGDAPQLKVRNAQTAQYFLRTLLGGWKPIPDTYQGPRDKLMVALYNMGELHHCETVYDLDISPEECREELGGLLDPALAN